MEEARFKKDESLYLVFACSKCKQYTYVKATQKTKKCLRCGRHHKVEKIANSGEIVKGMTKAVEEVKRKQNEIAHKEYGGNVEFRSFEDFIVPVPIKTETSRIDISECEDDLLPQFKKMLLEISETYIKFPFYIIEIMAENYEISKSELKILIKNCIQEKFLIKLSDYYQIGKD